MAKYAAGKPGRATRQCSGDVLEILLPLIPELIGGSADLTGSVNIQVKTDAIQPAVMVGAISITVYANMAWLRR